MLKKKFIMHGEKWVFTKSELKRFLKAINELKKQQWQHQVFRASEALVYREPGAIWTTKYTGQDYDETEAELVKAYWDHEHCEICSWKIHVSDDPKHSAGYTDGYEWLCLECYHQLIAKPLKSFD